jgi:hypothetical protein
LCVLERENEKVVFFLERENDCHDYYLLELGVRKNKKGKRKGLSESKDAKKKIMVF